MSESSQYFSAAPSSADVRRTVSARIWGRDYTFVTASGVFSRDRLDLGTSVLLRSVDPPVAGGTFLDLGCGYGPIACALAAEAATAHVWAVDVNERALVLTATNAHALGLAARVHPAQPDHIPADQTFDEIWSNPAIRIGKAELHRMLLRWLPRLTPAGTAWLVIGKNLGADSLQRWLGDQGYGCVRHASAKGFRVLRVTHPDPVPTSGHPHGRVAGQVSEPAAGHVADDASVPATQRAVQEGRSSGRHRRNPDTSAE